MAKTTRFKTIQALSVSMHEMRVPCQQLHHRLQFVQGEMMRYEVTPNADIAETLGQITSDFESFLRSNQDLPCIKRVIKRHEMVKAIGDLNQRVDHLAQEVRQRRPVLTTNPPVRSSMYSPLRSPAASLHGMKLPRPTVDDVIRQLRAIKQNVETLDRGTNLHKDDALRALKHIARDPIYRTAVASAGAIRPLVEVLETGSNPQREVALEIFLDLVAGRPGIRRAVVEVGGLHPLAELATEGTDSQKKLASSLLRNLSEVYTAALEEGGDLRAEHLKVRCQNMHVNASSHEAKLGQLVRDTHDVETSAATSKLFGMAFCVELLRSGTEAQKDAAVNTSKRIINDYYRAVDLVAAGAIPVLAQLAAGGTKTQRMTAAGCLMLLCNSSSMRLRCLIRYVTPIYHFIWTSIGSREEIEEAVSVVRFFSWEDDEYHSSRQQNETVIDIDCDDPNNHKTLAMVSGISAYVKQSLVGSGEHREATTEALYSLAGEEQVYLRVMVDIGAIEVLVVLARDGSKLQRTYALKTLSQIAHDDGIHLALVAAAGGVVVLIKRARNGSGTQKEAALTILELISRSDDHYVPIMVAQVD